MVLGLGLVLALPVWAQEAQTKPQRDVAELYRAAVAGDSQALEQLRTLATGGEAVAQYNLGLIYENGPGVPRDYAEAMRWYRLAAGQGLVSAQYNLGYMYANGQGVPQNYVEAARWFREAADQGESRAQYSLGALYAGGHGVPQDFVYAHMWFNIAASRATGDDEKQYSGARDSLAARMTPQEIADAHKLAREWQPKQ